MALLGGLFRVLRASQDIRCMFTHSPQRRFLHSSPTLLGYPQTGTFWTDLQPRKKPPEEVERRKERRRDITPEAMQVVTALKHEKGNPKKLESLIKSKTSRLLRKDLLCALYLLQQHQEVDLAYRIFEVARKESWYKANIYLFRDMILLFVKHNRFDDAWRLMDELEEEGLNPTKHMFTDTIRNCLLLNDFETCFKFYNRLLETQCVRLDHFFFGTLIKKLQKAEKFELSDRVVKDFAEFIEKQKKQGVELIEEYDDFWKN